MTRWWWIRHGPTHQKAFTGWRDVPADLSNHAQIARLREHLPKDARIVSSDLIRAVATADALQSGQTRLPHNRALREFDFGTWDGLHFSEVAAEHPELSRRYWEQPGDVRPPEGESWNEVARRVNTVVDQLNAQGHADVIAVAHFGVILTQVQRASGSNAYDALAHEIAPLSVTEMIHDDGQWHIGQINHIP
ncbi:MAG: histidine phosphatase family protein [Pseudomonadota bacterium]